jgi:ferrochelatase
VRALENAINRSKAFFDLTCIESYPRQAKYIQALATKITNAATNLTDDFQLIYSAHSLPVSFIEEGDPYVDHIQESIREIEKLTNIPGRLCYQSRSGPVEWLSPSTPDMLQTLADEGCKNILMIPISFVSDHVETLYEIDMLYHDQANDLGMHLISSESLNCDPTFIEGLKELVLSHI